VWAKGAAGWRGVSFPSVLLALDVHYDERAATTAAVGFPHWDAAESILERVFQIDAPAAAYEPGQFFRRELPCLLHAIGQIAHPLELLVVDGHVWLRPGEPGLGAHLHDALGVPVVGMAKSRYRGGAALPVHRGDSRRPLWVTAVGCDPDQAAAHVRTMHGPNRIPTLLQRVDHLARGLNQMR
jgi:deoxyribonuclease V